MNEHDYLLRSVLENPADDLPRKVFADWLEENGQAQRAEFIRCQIEYAQLSSRCANELDAGYPRDLEDDLTSPKFYRKRCRCRVCSLRRRAYLSGRRYIVWDWVGGFDGGISLFFDSRAWTRGFQESIKLTTADFMQHARELFSQQPIERVKLSDFRITLHAWSDKFFGAPSPERSNFPSKLLEFLSGGKLWDFSGDDYGHNSIRRQYVTEQDELDNVSQACVQYGRQQAGLSANLPEPQLAKLN